MATEVTLPDLGDGIESGDVLEVFVSVGDVIAEGQDIVEMETDKATVPVPSSMGGKVSKIAVSEGDTVPIGGVLIEVEAEAAAASTPQASSPEPAAAAEPASAAEPTAAPSQSAPPAVDAPAQNPPPKQESAPPPVQPAPAPAPIAPQTVAATPAPPVAVTTGNLIPAGPAVRRFAREVGVDLNRVSGSGDGGRITRDDVLAAVRAASPVSTGQPAAPASNQPAQVAPATQTEAAARPGTAAVDEYGPVNVERMDRIRKTISKQMHASWSTVPRVTNFDDADITELERLRQASKEDYAKQGLKLTTMPFLIKAVATALKNHPSINATIDQENEQLIYKQYVNVGIAVDTDRGLVVPVMRNADEMSIPETTQHLAEMAGKVRSGQFAINELRGGTFTISNLGAIGGQYSTPIVNVPEVAILLVGRSRKLPVVMPDDTIQPRLMMPLSLSYDHRLVDGGTAARFLNEVIGYLEAPSRLLLAF